MKGSRDACADLCRDGHFPQAVFEASKAPVNLVKEKASRPDLDGAPLMRAVFSVNAPVLAFNDRANQAKRTSRKG
jgi:hypothetical protein